MFRKAERKKAKLRLGITGSSGSGKTWSALEIAFGITTGDKIFFIDTESGRGELYQGLRSKYNPDIIFDYQYCRLDAPFSPDRYVEAIKYAEKNGCEVLIIDSLSHAWAGEGGVLSIVDKAGGQFQKGWKMGTPKQNLLIDTLVSSKMHIICNLRAKTEYVVEKNDQGKNVPRKIGLAPIQRDQLEYEFTVFMSMDQDNFAHVTKDNTGIFNQEFIKPSPEMGLKLMDWLNLGFDSKLNFNNVVVPSLIEEINKSSNLNELKECFGKQYSKYYSEFREDFDKVTEAKDIKKQELMTLDVENMPVIPINSKYSKLDFLSEGVG